MDSRNKEENRKLGKSDALIAFCIFLFYFIQPDLMRMVGNAIPDGVTIHFRELVRGVLVFSFVLPVFVVVLIKRQGIGSIGLHMSNFWPALRLGLLFSIIPIVFGISAGLLYGGEFVGFGQLMFLLFISLLFASSEDITFVGFIQTRLCGLFKSDKVAVCIGATMFSIMHIPPWLRTGQISFDDLYMFIMMVIFWFVMHIVLVCVYRRYKSLIAVITLHTLVNFSAYSLWVFADEYIYYAFDWVSIAAPVLIIAVGVWVFIRHRRTKKEQVQNKSDT
jgi:membrane protease YdiL (CAAX protease family)